MLSPLFHRYTSYKTQVQCIITNHVQWPTDYYAPHLFLCYGSM